VKIGLIPGTGGTFPCAPSDVRAIVHAAEEGGFDSLWLGEHVVLPAYPRQDYPGSKEGLPGPSAGQLPDPLDWLAFAAATSDTLLLGTAILILPLHNPLVMAKRLATIDQLSGGRLLLGIGVGWNEQEFESVGASFRARGRRCDEMIKAMRGLWADDISTFDGELVSYEPVYCSPKPTKGAVPIYVGGSVDAAAVRAGRLGDGFIPFERDFDRLSQLVVTMRRAAEDAGRDPASIPITALGSIRPDRIERLVDLGVERMLLFTPGFEPERIVEFGQQCQQAIKGR
jgi:probable F420-dependent oxidoreductase